MGTIIPVKVVGASVQLEGHRALSSSLLLAGVGGCFCFSFFEATFPCGRPERLQWARGLGLQCNSGEVRRISPKNLKGKKLKYSRINILRKKSLKRGKSILEDCVPFRAPHYQILPGELEGVQRHKE